MDFIRLNASRIQDITRGERTDFIRHYKRVQRETQQNRSQIVLPPTVQSSRHVQQRDRIAIVAVFKNGTYFQHVSRNELSRCNKIYSIQGGCLNGQEQFAEF